MAKETERKFLVSNDSWKSIASDCMTIKQGYLSTDPARSVRVRTNGNLGFITVKGSTRNLTRDEFEYTIPLAEASELLKICVDHLIEKTRYIVPFGGLVWEVDVFSGMNEGLIIAEVELTDPGESLQLPGWAGKEVSTDERYYNASLAVRPFTTW